MQQNEGESIFHAVLMIARELPEEQKTKYHISSDMGEYDLLKNTADVNTKFNNQKYFKRLMNEFNVSYLDLRS